MIPAAHVVERVAPKEATCEQPGNTEYFKCIKCDKLFSDSEGKTETTLEAVTIRVSHALNKTEAKDRKSVV